MNLKVVPLSKRTQKKPRTAIRPKASHLGRGLLFCALAAITAGSIYLLKHPERVQKPVAPPTYHAPTKPAGGAPASAPVKLESAEVQLYFSDPGSDLLVEESRSVVWRAGDLEGQIRTILDALREGPRGELVNPIPSHVAVRKISLRDGTATINFSKELIDNHPGGSLAEMHTIYAIVNSLLLNLSALSQVQLLVEGKAPETLKGHIDCRTPFTPNLSIVKKS